MSGRILPLSVLAGIKSIPAPEEGYPDRTLSTALNHAISVLHALHQYAGGVAKADLLTPQLINWPLLEGAWGTAPEAQALLQPHQLMKLMDYHEGLMLKIGALPGVPPKMGVVSASETHLVYSFIYNVLSPENADAASYRRAIVQFFDTLNLGPPLNESELLEHTTELLEIGRGRIR